MFLEIENEAYWHNDNQWELNNNVYCNDQPAIMNT